METDFGETQTFRFRAPAQSAQSGNTYLATRQNPYWSVTLEGYTEPWMRWLVTDETVRESYWDHRLTD